MKINKRHILLLLVLPLPVFILPFITLIPGLEPGSIWIGMALMSIPFLYVAIKTYTNQTLQTKFKWFTLLIGAVIATVYISAYWLVDFNQKFTLSSQSVQKELRHKGNVIYIQNEFGLFNQHNWSMIGYSQLFSPVYRELYKTRNYLELVESESNDLLVREYTYRDGVRDSIRKGLIPKYQQEKVEIQIIEIDLRKAKRIALPSNDL